MQDKINIIFGPTAAGKSNFAISLAKKINGVIINADSMQVYKEIKTLTAQPDAQALSEVEHLLYAYISCGEEYNVARWLSDCLEKINYIQKAGKTPILVGGTGMYIKALIDGLADIKIPQDIRDAVTNMSTVEVDQQLKDHDQKAFSKFKPNDYIRKRRALEISLSYKDSAHRVINANQAKPFLREQFYLMLLNFERDELYRRINLRFDKMLEEGALDEVKNLLEHYPKTKLPKAHGVQELIDYLYGNITLKEAVARTKQKSRNYAKRQFTWARHQLTFDEVINGGEL